MTCYVDDIVLSGPGATKGLLYDVRRIIQRYGLIAKDEKSKTFSATKPKTVTGVVITPKGLRVPNKRLYEIRRVRQQIKHTTAPRERERLMRTLDGRLQEAKQIAGVDADEGE